MRTSPTRGIPNLACRGQRPSPPCMSRPMSSERGRDARAAAFAGGPGARADVEIGSGTGLNLAHYPDDLDGLALAEPDPSMRSAGRPPCGRSGREAQVIDAAAERLPFADGASTRSSRRSSCVRSTTPDARCARSRGCCARTGSCCSSSTCAPTRHCSPLAGSPRGPWRRFAGAAGATAQPPGCWPGAAMSSTPDGNGGR